VAQPEVRGHLIKSRFAPGANASRVSIGYKYHTFRATGITAYFGNGAHWNTPIPQSRGGVDQVVTKPRGCLPPLAP
jgi:hypothetical protein